jgi:hypothetical protein
MAWSTSDFIAGYAAILSTVIAAREIYKSATSGPKIIGDATLRSSLSKMYKQNDGNITDAEIDIRITNSGNAPTTLFNFRIEFGTDQIGLPFTTLGEKFDSVRIDPNDTREISLLTNTDLEWKQLSRKGFVIFKRSNGGEAKITLKIADGLI